MGCVQSYFRKGSYDVYEAHNAGLSPSSTQGSDKAVLAADDVLADQLDDIEKDIVIVDVDEIKLAEKQDEAETPRVASADENGSAKTGAIIAAAAGTGAVLGVAGAALASAEQLEEPAKSPDTAVTPENIEVASRVSSAASASKSIAEANDNSRPLSAAKSETSEVQQPDDGSRPASEKEEGAPEEEEQVESAEPVPEVDSSRPESAAKSEDLGSRPTSASPNAAEVAVDSRPESQSKVDVGATESEVGSRAESVIQEAEPVEEGTRPTSASVSIIVSEPKDSRSSSIAVSDKDESNTPEPTEFVSVSQQGNPDIQIDDYSEAAPESPVGENRPESSAPFVIGQESDSSRPQSTTESTIQDAVNPETGTPQDRVSRVVSTTDSSSASEQTSEQELTHEGSIVEPEEVKDTSSKPPTSPESITEEPSSLPSVSIDAEELGVEEDIIGKSQADEDVKETVSDSVSEGVPINKEDTLEVGTDEDANEQEAGEGSRPISASQSIGAESDQTKESSRPASAATLIVGQDDGNVSRPDSSIEQGSDTKPSESRPTSRVESTTGSDIVQMPVEITESRPESVVSKAESGVASVSEVDVMKSPAETPRSDTEMQESRPGSGVRSEANETSAPQTRPSSSVSQVIAAESPKESIPIEDDLPAPPVEDESMLNDAATTIQATFRGHQTRQALKKQDDGVNNTDDLPLTEDRGATEPDEELDSAATKIQANYRGYKTRQEIKNKKDGSNTDDNNEVVTEELPPPSIISDSNAELESAATTIQSNFRGYQTRQTLKKQAEGNDIKMDEFPAPPSAQETDTELESAATTIQANFRGYQTRQALKKQVEGEDTDSVEVGTENLPSPPTDADAELESAATTIQANFRGYQTRQALKKKTDGEDIETGEITDAEDLLPSSSVQETDTELESAATTIQANYRGYQTRQALKKQVEGEDTESVEVTNEDLPPPPDVPSSDAELESAATTIQANFRGYQTRQALKKNVDGEDIDTGDVAEDISVPPSAQETDPELESAATTIQANFRGYQTRQALKENADGEDINTVDVAEDILAPPSAQETDPELESAATTIQANFRGYQTRQALKKNADGEDTDTGDVAEDISAPPSAQETDPELESAATTIQANFRGYQTRQALKKNADGEDTDTGDVAEDISALPIAQETDSELESAATTIQANFRGYQTRQNLKKEAEGEGTEALVEDLPTPLESDMELESAATTIQANFRGYQTRKTLKTANEGTSGPDASEVGATTSPVQENESVPEILAGPEDEELVSAATTIQANFRGHQTRQALKKQTEGETGEAVVIPSEEVTATEDENDLKSNEDEVSAATTIQANFRGYQTRQALKKSNEGATDLDVAESVAGDLETADILPGLESDAELVTAATTIQANFRGYQTRQTLKKGNEDTTDINVAESVAGDLQTAQCLLGPDPDTESAANDLQITNSLSATENDSELESAATTLQANFRGYQTRQALKKLSDGKNSEAAEVTTEDFVKVPETDEELESAATTIQANFRGYQTRQALKKTNEDDGNSESTIDDSPILEPVQEPSTDADLNSAATTIQANFRGYQTRQELKKQTEGAEVDKESALPEDVKEPETDAELVSAATTIQANYRGYQTRQSLKKQNEGEETKPDESSPIAETSKEPESDMSLDSAATTIQANFRGYQTRQAMKKTDASAKIVGNSETPPAASPGPDTMQILAEQSQTRPIDTFELHNELFGSPTAEIESSLTEVTTADASITDTTSEREGSLINEPIGTTATPRSPETGEKVKEFSEEDQENLKDLQKPQECDELPSQRGMNGNSSIEFDSSQSSAATKIQAGVRGFIARRQVQNMRNETSTSTTAPSLPDSQQSFGISISQDDGVQAVGSPETEVQKQQNITMEEESKNDPLTVTLLSDVSNKLESEATAESSLSLDSELDSVNEKAKSEIRSSISEQATPREVEDEDQQVWQTLQKELEEAATTIQSNYRGYRTRQKLQREDAIQMPTTSSSTVSNESEAPAANIPHSGEFHDMIVLPPVTPTIPETENSSDQKP